MVLPGIMAVHSLNEVAYRHQRLRRVVVRERMVRHPRQDVTEPPQRQVRPPDLQHDAKYGNAALRRHIDNADRKPDHESRKLRIVKREQALKIDLTVCLSMALITAQRLGL